MEATKLSDTKCKLLNLLIGKGADLNKALSDNQTALHFAVHCRNFEALKALLKSGADTSIGMADAAYGVPGKNLYTPLYNAVLYGHREIILALLEAGADTNIGIAKEHWSQNLLVRAVYNNKKWLAELLLKYGASSEVTYLSSTQKAALTALLAKNIHSDPADIEKNKDSIEILDLRGLPLKEIPVGVNQLQKCRALYLGGNLFKKLDLKELATQTLEYLSFQNALLTEINYAGSLNSLAKLKVMDLRGNKLKKSAINELRSLLPSCIIIENDVEMEKQAGVIRVFLS